MMNFTELLDSHTPTTTLWDQWHADVQAALETLNDSDVALTVEQCWTLTGWAETVASQAVRTEDATLVAKAVAALGLVEQQQRLDRRDLWIVTDVLHEAATLIGATNIGLPPMTSVAERFTTREPGPLDLHVGTGSGPDFRFERKPSNIDTDALLDWFDAGTDN